MEKIQVSAKEGNINAVVFSRGAVEVVSDSNVSAGQVLCKIGKIQDSVKRAGYVRELERIQIHKRKRDVQEMFRAHILNDQDRQRYRLKAPVYEVRLEYEDTNWVTKYVDVPIEGEDYTVWYKTVDEAHAGVKC